MTQDEYDHFQDEMQKDREKRERLDAALIKAAEPADAFATAGNLFALMADPAAASKKLAELRGATEAAEAAKAEAEKAQAQAKADRAALDEEIYAARAKLANQLVRHDDEMTARTRAVKAREQLLDQTESDLKARVAQVEQLKADLERRVDAVTKAAAGPSS